MPNTRSARLARWQVLLLTFSGGSLWLSGAAWLLLHYFGTSAGEFGPQANPLEPWLLRLHGLAMIPALLGFGGLLVVHIPKGWQDAAQRNIGLALTALIVVLIGSGYLLYYLGAESVRNQVSFAHWVTGLAVPLPFIWHQMNGQSRKKAAKRPPLRQPRN
jgi:hypothetical protein